MNPAHVMLAIALAPWHHLAVMLALGWAATTLVAVMSGLSGTAKSRQVSARVDQLVPQVGQAQATANTAHALAAAALPMAGGTISGSLQVATLGVGGAPGAAGTLTVYQGAGFHTNITVSGACDVVGNLTVEGAAAIATSMGGAGTLSVGGTIGGHNNLYIDNYLYAKNTSTGASQTQVTVP